MNISTIVRGKYFQALSGLKYGNVAIPIFDEVVNPSAVIPVINGAECYVILQNQQERDDGVQIYCQYRILADITVKVVTKFGTTGGKKLSEDIADLIDSKIRSGRNTNLISVADVSLIERSTVESNKDNLAFQKILIYTNTINI